MFQEESSEEKKTTVDRDHYLPDKLKESWVDAKTLREPAVRIPVKAEDKTPPKTIPVKAGNIAE